MSRKLTDQVWPMRLEPPLKIVLLCLAEHAWEDGSHAQPGLRRLSQHTGYSVSQCRRILRKLEGQGRICQVREGQGRGQRSSYTVHPCRCTCAPLFDQKGVTDGTFSSAGKGVISIPKKVSSGTEKGVISTPFQEDVLISEPNNESNNLKDIAKSNGNWESRIAEAYGQVVGWAISPRDWPLITQHADQIRAAQDQEAAFRALRSQMGLLAVGRGKKPYRYFFKSIEPEEEMRRPRPAKDGNDANGAARSWRDGYSEEDLRRIDRAAKEFEEWKSRHPELDSMSEAERWTKFFALWLAS